MNKFHLSNRDLYAYIQLIIGLFVFAAGIVFMLKANLGMVPWSAGNT
jgi:uncharacterized membrane protein YczE